MGALRISQLGPGCSKVQWCCSAVEELKFVCKTTRNVWLCDLMPRVSVGEASRLSRKDACSLDSPTGSIFYVALAVLFERVIDIPSVLVVTAWLHTGAPHQMHP